MENADNSKKSPTNTGFGKMPKNIRQIGTIKDRNTVIYVEDYVMTYIKQLSAKEYTGCKVAVLLGYYIPSEEGRNLFIKGAIEMKNVDISSTNAFSDEAWTRIYENIKTYFTDVEIVGWSLIGPDFFLDNGDRLRKIHMDNFSGTDKALLKMDSMEKEEAFYLFDDNQLVKMSGYYIYYEKNEEMQNYMLENKNIIIEEHNYVDHTTKKIREIINEKKEPRTDKNVIRILYIASTTLVILVLVIAASMLNNYGQLKNMENAINAISKTLNINNTNSAEENSFENTIENVQNDTETTNDVMVKDNETKTTNGETTPMGVQNTSMDETVDMAEDDQAHAKETMAVETVPGNISAEKPTDTETDTESDATKDTGKTGDTGSKKNVDKTTDKTSDSVKNTKQQQESETAETASKTNYYVIKEGDSLAGISLKLYNSYNYIDEIKKLNNIEDENKIFAGQKIIVP